MKKVILSIFLLAIVILWGAGIYKLSSMNTQNSNGKSTDIIAIFIEDTLEVNVKIRYSSKEAKAKIKQEGKYIKVEFEEPQKAITPGQSAVFYIGDIVVGGGKIILK